MIDIHSHIIPKIDDGAKDLDVSLKLLEMAQNHGTKSIVATPHYYRGFYEFEYKNIEKQLKYLKDLTRDNNINIDIYHGQEICSFRGMTKALEEKKIGTINNTRYMLIEFPLQEFQKDILDEIYELQLKGIVPIIAHPERYKIFKNNPEKINELISEGYLFQLNSGSILGTFSKETKKTAEIFLRNNIYSFIGSDAHNLTSRTSSFKEITNSLDSKYTDEYNKNGSKMLNNKDVKFNGERVEKRKRFLFFKL